MITHPSDPERAIDAALQVVGVEYHTEDELLWLTQEDATATSVTSQYAALTSRYRLQSTRHGGSASLATDWAGTEQWLMTPHRIVGVVEIEPLSEQWATAVQGRIRLGDGRSNAPMPVLSREAGGWWSFGSMAIHIHEHNFAAVFPGTLWTRTSSAQGRYAELLLRDDHGYRHSTTRRFEINGHEVTDLSPQLFEPQSYSPGTRHYFVIEAHPDWNEASQQVSRHVTADGLYMLELHAADEALLLVHNPTEHGVTYQLPLAWLDYTESSISALGSPGGDPLLSDGRPTEVEVPPHGHVLLVK